MARAGGTEELGAHADWGNILPSSPRLQPKRSSYGVQPPGEVNLRYLVLAWHTRQRRSDGKRDDKYILTIGDSQANARNRDVEGPQKDVQWVLEGGICTTITEVDESTIDVVCEQWAGCLSEQHGRELYIDWIRFPVCLEQNVSPARLLCL